MVGKWFTNANKAIGLINYVLIKVTDQQLKLIAISKNHTGQYSINANYYNEVYNRI
ncbi:MAG: hypothetical protein ACRCWI_06520 [Brevinema sp.]